MKLRPDENKNDVVTCPTKSQILAAAATSPAAKEALKKLFPELFVPQPLEWEEVHATCAGTVSTVVPIVKAKNMSPIQSSELIQVNRYYDFKGKGLYLHYNYKWEIKIDSEDHQILVATPRS